MNDKNQEEKKDITLAELATEMREGFKSVREEMRSEISGVRQEMREGLKSVRQEVEVVHQGIETLNTKIDTVEENLSGKIKFEVSRLEERTFSPDEKDSIMDTVELVNNQLEASVLGKRAITLTREEYDAASRVQGFPSRFEGFAEIAVD